MALSPNTLHRDSMFGPSSLGEVTLMKQKPLLLMTSEMFMSLDTSEARVLISILHQQQLPY